VAPPAAAPPAAVPAAAASADPSATATPPPSPASPLKPTDTISQAYFDNAAKVLDHAASTTPPPAAASINAPPPPKATKAQPYEAVYEESLQPLDTKFGSAMMSAFMGEQVTGTPPPSQSETDAEFVAQCPMVLFNQELAIRAPSCNNTRGKWVDPNPLNPRTVLRWQPLQTGGIRLAVDSALDGKGSTLFGNVHEDFTLTSYQFSLQNCLDVPRYILEESVFKVNNIGHVTSTIDVHDVTQNSVAYFFRYSVKSPAGNVVAESSLYRTEARVVNFTEVKNGENTGKILATATKQGLWEKDGWEECMSKESPRGWNIHFPESIEAKAKKGPKSHVGMATVQDIRVAIATAITVMGYRDEARGANGLNTTSVDRQSFMLLGFIALFFMGVILMINFNMMCVGSGMKAQLKKILYDSEGAFLPKKKYQSRSAELNAAW